MNTITQLKIDRSLFVEARLYFDKTYGNTYYSARIWVDGSIVSVIPMTYGYDNQYLYGARDELIKLGYLPAEYADKPLWQARQDLGFDLYHSESYEPKKRLFKENN